MLVAPSLSPQRETFTQQQRSTAEKNRITKAMPSKKLVSSAKDGWMGFVRNPVYDMSLRTRPVSKLRFIPLDSWPDDINQGAAIMDGVYGFAGERRRLSNPWNQESKASELWLKSAHSFSWLRGLRSLGSDEARIKARSLVNGWLKEYHHDYSGLSWRADIIGERLSSWIFFHNFFCASANESFKQRIYQDMQRQAIHLARILPGNTKGYPLLQGIKGLIISGLCIEGGESRLQLGIRLLRKELVSQFLADGMHYSRNPYTQMEAVKLLIDLRMAFSQARVEIPTILDRTLQSASQCLAFLCHGDGRLALFHGGTEGAQRFIQIALQKSGTKIKKNYRLGQFHRLAVGDSVVMMDVGAMPANKEIAHAAPLAFEFSHGRERLIVNCGGYSVNMGVKNADWQKLLKCTKAHSTITLGNHNAICRNARGSIYKPTTPEKEQLDGLVAEGSHDGYQHIFGTTHRRCLYLSQDGYDLRGEDRLIGQDNLNFIAHFHLHPSVEAQVEEEGKVMLRTADGMEWEFIANFSPVLLEKSAYFGYTGNKPKATKVITINGVTESGETTIKWCLRRVA
ncbi:MAG: heparinase II/III family protein [Alphaproteobacteria bacterium]